MMIRRRAALLVPGSAISAAKSCLRLCSTSPLFSPSPPTPPRLFDNAGYKGVKPFMILPGRDAQFMPAVIESLKVPVLTLKTYPQGDTIVYFRQDIQKCLIPLHFETPLNDEDIHVLAVFATVKVMIFDTFQPAHDISGRIVAKYGNGNHCLSDEDVNRMETMLFNQSPDQTVRAVTRTPIQLSTQVVAVPTHASLTIEADLSASRHEISKGYAEFPVQGSGQFSKLIRGKRGLLLVGVTWSSVDPRLDLQDLTT